MAPRPNAKSAVLDLRKLEEYCLNPLHPRGRHKARVFREALGIGRRHAGWLRQQILTALTEADAVELETDHYGRRWRADITVARQNRRAVVRTLWLMRTGESAPRFVKCWVAMTKDGEPSELDVVALLTDRPNEGLARGQVGTVVEVLNGNSALVEFSDDEGRAYAVVPCSYADLMVLHYAPEAA